MVFSPGVPELIIIGLICLLVFVLPVVIVVVMLLAQRQSTTEPALIPCPGCGRKVSPQTMSYCPGCGQSLTEKT